MTFVADFTPEQRQNASAGRRYGQRKREALTALIEKWRREAADEQRVSFCADELEAVLNSRKART